MTEVVPFSLVASVTVAFTTGLRPLGAALVLALAAAWSAAVAPGYGTVSTSSQRSTAMMSAPSSASRIAWLRPCPRAAPVMKATLPATRPGMETPLVVMR